MFFLFAIPPLLETLGTVVLATFTARIANDVYDAATKKNESDE